MDRSGPSIESKIVLVAVAALLVQDVLLLVMYSRGASAQTVQILLGSVVVLAIAAAAAWGNALARAIRRLSRACYVARMGDTRVLTELPRTDELGELNREINELVVLLRDLRAVEAELASSESVASSASVSAPEMTHAAQEVIISLKELREGAAGELMILRKLGDSLGQARRILAGVALEAEAGAGGERESASKLRSLEGVAREIDVLSDQAVDEVARETIDEVALARIMNGLRDAARTMVEVASQASGRLEKTAAGVQVATEALRSLEVGAEKQADGGRVAELMERSATAGLSAAMRLASIVKRLGLVIEAYAAQRRATRGS